MCLVLGGRGRKYKCQGQVPVACLNAVPVAQPTEANRELQPSGVTSEVRARIVFVALAAEPDVAHVLASLFWRRWPRWPCDRSPLLAALAPEPEPQSREGRADHACRAVRADHAA